MLMIPQFNHDIIHHVYYLFQKVFFMLFLLCVSDTCIKVFFLSQNLNKKESHHKCHMYKTFNGIILSCNVFPSLYFFIIFIFINWILRNCREEWKRWMYDECVWTSKKTYDVKKEEDCWKFGSKAHFFGGFDWDN